MLWLCFMRAARTSGVAPLPNSRSNTTCGLSSIGSGLVRGVGSPSRRRQLDPRDRIRVRAAVAFAAVAGAGVGIFNRKLQRRQQALLPDLPRDDLIDGGAAGRGVGPGGLARLDGRQERRGDPVVRTGRPLGRLGRLRPEAADDRGLVLHLLEPFEDVRQLRREARPPARAPNSPAPCRAGRRRRRTAASAPRRSAPAAVLAGTIASSRGRANVTPAPLRNVRRGICFFEIYISVAPFTLLSLLPALAVCAVTGSCIFMFI